MADDDRTVSSRHIGRAPRYPVELAMQYWDGRDDVWRDGRTKNVSASGVLFEVAPADWRLRLHAGIQMNLLMPLEIAGQVAARVVCSGRVARIVVGRTSGRVHVAATIERQRLERSGDGRQES